MKTPVLRIVLAAAVGLVFTGCTANKDVTARLDALEAKTNQAMKNAAAAKVDATTALHIATMNQEKVAAMEDKTNQAMQNAAAAKIDATTALSVSTRQ